MAKPNYSYEKRQRELEKKRKKEEKALRKAAGGNAEPDSLEAPDTSPDQALAAPDDTAPAADTQPSTAP